MGSFSNRACVRVPPQVKLVNIRNDDIADGNPKLTLGLIWTIILHFQVKPTPPPPPSSLLCSRGQGLSSATPSLPPSAVGQILVSPHSSSPQALGVQTDQGGWGCPSLQRLGREGAAQKGFQVGGGVGRGSKRGGGSQEWFLEEGRNVGCGWERTGCCGLWG